jgi:hypothetical protein
MKHSRVPGVAFLVGLHLFFAMKKIITSALLAAGLTAAVCFADSTGPAQVPNEIDYVKQLPSPNDLVNANVPAGATVSAITTTSSDVTVTYTYSNGQTSMVSYHLLPAAGSNVAAENAGVVTSSTPTPSTPAPAPVYYATSPAYTVVYDQPAPVYYYPAYGYGYYPYWPVSVNVGWGWGHGWGWGRGWGYRGGWGGGWRGGFRR